MPHSEVILNEQRLDLTPAAVLAAEAQLLQLPQVECPLRHYFAPGVCIREVTLPAGALIVGHAHRFADLNIMLTGRLTLLQDDGSLKELVAPQTFLGHPGRKIAYIHETVVWQNAWPTRVKAESGKRKAETEWVELGTDVEAIEAHYLDKSPYWQAHAEQRLALDRLARQPDRCAFDRFVAQREWDAETVRRISENQADQIPMPAGEWTFLIGDSAIEGKGVLATADIPAGGVVGPMRLDGQRTPLGRYTNHAAVPNAEVRSVEGDLWLVARANIHGCRGGQPGEEITVDYEQALAANAASAVENAKTKGLELCQP